MAYQHLNQAQIATSTFPYCKFIINRAAAESNGFSNIEAVFLSYYERRKGGLQ